MTDVVKTRTGVTVKCPYRVVNSTWRGMYDRPPTWTDALEYLANPSQWINKVTGAESITYSQKPKPLFNNCLHIKDEITISPLVSAIVTYQDPVIQGDGRPLYWWKYSGYCETCPQQPAVPLSYTITDDMRARAWQSMIPKLNSGFSLINFLWELKDFGQLISTAKKLSTMLRKLDRDLFGTKTASQLTLSWEYGIKATYRDICELLKTLQDVNRAVDNFIAHGKVPNNYHYTEEIARTSTDTPTWWGRIRTENIGVYHATCRLKYRYERPSYLTTLMRVWGFRLTPEAIWNAIPFSFVIDWVLKVGKSLEQLDEDPALKVEILDYCDSVKSTSSKELWRDENTGTSYGASYNHSVRPSSEPLWRWERTKYNRTVGLPNTGYALPAFDSLSMRELVLSAALARARN